METAITATHKISPNAIRFQDLAGMWSGSSFRTSLQVENSCDPFGTPFVSEDDTPDPITILTR
jgi:hypothetical protein